MYFAISSSVLIDKKGNQLAEGDTVLFEEFGESREVTIFFGSYETTSDAYQYINSYGFHFFNDYHDESLNEKNAKKLTLISHKFEA